MRATKRPAPVGRERARKRKGQYFNHHYLKPGALEKATKNWAVNRLMKRFYDNVDNAETRHASRFWKKSGRRLTHV